MIRTWGAAGSGRDARRGAASPASSDAGAASSACPASERDSAVRGSRLGAEEPSGTAEASGRARREVLALFSGASAGGSLAGASGAAAFFSSTGATGATGRAGSSPGRLITRAADTTRAVFCALGAAVGVSATSGAAASAAWSVAASGASARASATGASASAFSAVAVLTAATDALSVSIPAAGATSASEAFSPGAAATAQRRARVRRARRPCGDGAR